MLTRRKLVVDVQYDPDGSTHWQVSVRRVGAGGITESISETKHRADDQLYIRMEETVQNALRRMLNELEGQKTKGRV